MRSASAPRRYNRPTTCSPPRQSAGMAADSAYMLVVRRLDRLRGERSPRHVTAIPGRRLLEAARHHRQPCRPGVDLLRRWDAPPDGTGQQTNRRYRPTVVTTGRNACMTLPATGNDASPCHRYSLQTPTPARVRRTDVLVAALDSTTRTGPMIESQCRCRATRLRGASRRRHGGAVRQRHSTQPGIPRSGRLPRRSRRWPRRLGCQVRTGQ